MPRLDKNNFWDNSLATFFSHLLLPFQGLLKTPLNWPCCTFRGDGQETPTYCSPPKWRSTYPFILILVCEVKIPGNSLIFLNKTTLRTISHESLRSPIYLWSGYETTFISPTAWFCRNWFRTSYSSVAVMACPTINSGDGKKHGGASRVDFNSRTGLRERIYSCL